MTNLSIAHYGTTLSEAPPPPGADQAAQPMTGDLERTHSFLTILGMEIYISNMYPDVGRQYIYRRGDFSDPDYFEKDTFTSYVAAQLPKANSPRVGETIFRITHHSPVSVVHQLLEKALIQPLSSVEDFIHGKADRLLFTGPDLQQYELIASQQSQFQNHRIYVWTDANELAAHKLGYQNHFAIAYTTSEDFYGIGTAHLLVREDPGITIALLTSPGNRVTPKTSFDIFSDAGYSHFRLAATDKKATLASSEEAFPDGGGDVSYVHFQNSYLELVQI